MTSAISREIRRTRHFLTLSAGIAFLWAAFLSVSPGLHERVHPGAGVEHNCAVTLVSAGHLHNSASSALFSAESPLVQLAKIAALNPVWIQSLFLVAGVFEHGPPAFNLNG